eukprot:9402273-Lingulodinium_polyedra.AAC.1
MPMARCQKQSRAVVVRGRPAKGLRSWLWISVRSAVDHVSVWLTWSPGLHGVFPAVEGQRSGIFWVS